MQGIDNVGITFASTVIGTGAFNNVINVTLGAMQFTPSDKGILPDIAITARLRMDIPCAEALIEDLTKLLIRIRSKPPAEAAGEIVVEGKPN